LRGSVHLDAEARHLIAQVRGHRSDADLHQPSHLAFFHEPRKRAGM
jgi:hypothetical protein